MPASLTITAFYSFSANTTIYSAQVNNNFNLFRGNLLPIDGSATSFANNAYDLGSSSFRWKNGYFTNLNIADTSDNTKIATFNMSSITAGQTRTYTLPNETGTLQLQKTMTVQKFNSGTDQTYTLPAGCRWIKVKVRGGGGGGGADVTNNGASGTASTFGTSGSRELTAGGGTGGAKGSGGTSAGGAGGLFTVNSTFTDVGSIAGQSGNGASSGANTAGGLGGGQGGGAGGGTAIAGGGAGTNTGAGGGGGGGGAGTGSGGGGGQGGYIEAIQNSPASTYVYSVGAGGAGGTGGNYNGGNGGAGQIIVEEYY